MSDKRWYQVRWSAERTDNISATDLKDAYAQSWAMATEEPDPGIEVDSQSVDVTDMVTDHTYHVPAEYLLMSLADGWALLADDVAVLEPHLETLLEQERTG